MSGGGGGIPYIKPGSAKSIRPLGVTGTSIRAYLSLYSLLRRFKVSHQDNTPTYDQILSMVYRVRNKHEMSVHIVHDDYRLVKSITNLQYLLYYLSLKEIVLMGDLQHVIAIFIG